MISDAIDLVADEMPKFNVVLAEGLSYHQLMQTHQLVDKLMRIALRSDEDSRLPKGFNYDSYELMSPLDDYLSRSKKDNKTSKSKRGYHKGFDVTTNDTYMVNYKFNVDGEMFARPVLIPFARRGGIHHIRGVKYGINTVLKTRGVCATEKGYFIEFHSSKVQFEWLNHVYDINGMCEHVYLPYSTSLHHKKKRTKTIIQPPVAGWLFAKFGPRDTFKRFLNMDVDFYDVDDPALREIDTDTYAICTGGLAVNRRKCNFAVVARLDELTPEAKIVIGSMLYSGRNYPDRVDISNIESETTWRLVLGVAILGDKNAANQNILADIRSHFHNIEHMLDVEFRRELMAEDVIVDDIYDLLYYVICAFTNREMSNSPELANLWNRYYTCIEYVTYDIRSGIYNARWDLINQATDQRTQTTGNMVKRANVHRTLNHRINTNAASRLNTNHGEVNAFMSTTDNMIIALTSHCIDQTNANKKSSRKSIDLNSPANHMHVSFIEAGSIINLPKSGPIGPYRINMCVKINSRGRIIESENHKELKRELDMDIRQKGI